MTPVISVIITCYNQEAYIQQCLDGVLMQKNCPPFEVIVGDDCSTDNTRNIIKAYAKKYKNVFLLDRKKNLGMLHNLKQCFESARGKYVAICEGDDYWTDAEKLKKQYDALSADRNAYLCFSNIELLSDGKIKSHMRSEKAMVGNHITIADLLTYNYIGNFSCCMYKKTALKFIPNSYWENNLNADYVMHLYMLDASRYAIFLKEPMSVYRILSNSISHKDAYPVVQIKLIEMLEVFNMATKYKYQKELDGFYVRLFPVGANISNKNYKRWLGLSFPLFSKRVMVGIGVKNKK